MNINGNINIVGLRSLAGSAIARQLKIKNFTNLSVPTHKTLDTAKSESAPRTLMDVSVLENMGWKSILDIKCGFEKTYGRCLTRGSK